MFIPGQKVVCVDSAPREGWKFTIGREKFLKKGRIYTIKEYFIKFYLLNGNTAKVRLVEDLPEFKPDSGWLADRFRPIVEQKTDISELKKLLNPTEIVNEEGLQCEILKEV